MIRIAITGASGFVGEALVKRFNALSQNSSDKCIVSHDASYRVLALIRDKHSLSTSNLAEVEFIVIGDIVDAVGCELVLSGVDVLVHAAARVHVMNDSVADPLAEFRRVNVDGTLNLARQAAAAGVRRFIFLSSVKVNGEETAAGKLFTEQDEPAPQDPYGQSKYEAEVGLRKLSAETGMEVVIVRAPLVYGLGVKANFAALMNAVKRGWPLPLGAVSNQRSLLSLDNLVDFIVTCTTHPQAANQTFLVSDGQDLSTPELIQGMARAAGVSERLWFIPVWALKAFAGLMGKGATVQRLCGNLQVDITKARVVLGWKPPVNVDEALQRAMDGN